jgi:hypothetical protein
MHMVIVVVALSAVLFTKRISDTVICTWNGMDNAFAQKGIEGSVHGYPVESLTRTLLYIAMRKSARLRQKQFQNLHPAIRYAKPVSFEDILNGCFHN